MRRSAIIVTVLLPFVFAALPLLAVFMTGDSPAYAGGTIAVSPSLAAVATARTVPTDNTLAQSVVAQSTQDSCTGTSSGVQG